MKKTILLFFMSLFIVCGYAQGITPAEGFEGATFPPTGWTKYNNGIGNLQQWKQTVIAANDTYPPHTGDHAAFIDRENVPDAGDPAKDWLVTPSFEMPVNGQLRFWSSLTLPGNQGTIYKILMAPAGADLSDLASYTIVSTYTEPLINPTQTEYNEVILNLPGTTGQNYHIAFLMEGDFQDRWLVDDVSIVEQCLAPTNLNAVSTTPTSASLSWAGAALQYEIEVMPVSEAPDGSGDIVNGTSTTVSPLIPTTAYKFYVRSVCSEGNTSEWAGPFNFYTQPANDDCANAIALTVNTTNICTTSTFGTVAGATPSNDGSDVCAGTEDDDVWFTFVATDTTHLINLNNPANGSTDLNNILYSGTCGSLTQVSCNLNNNTTVTGLTIGETYTLRVYSAVATSQNTTFDVCIGTPPPPPVNDECAGATTLIANPDLDCENIATGTVYSATASPQGNTCFGSDDDDVWYQFVATNPTHTINLSNITGSTTLLYHTVYSGNCGALTQMYCSTATTSITSTLTVGNIYYVRVYSSATTAQTSVFDICIATPPGPPVNDECNTALSVPVNPDLNCTLFTSGTVAWATPSPENATICSGTEDDDVWFSFIATNPTHTINLNNVEGSTNDLNHTIYSGACGSLTNILCSSPNNSYISGLTVGNTYFIRVFTATSTALQTTTFDVCIGTPPAPPANDDCANAITVPVNADLNCTNSVPGTVEWATPSPQSGTTCNGTEDDDVWYEFVATSVAHRIRLTDIAGSATLLYHTVYSGTSCGDMTLLYCSNGSDSFAGNLTIGNTYFIRVYTSADTPQNTTFNVCVSTPPPPPVNDECANATVVTVNPDLSCASVTPGTISWATPSLESNTCNGVDDDDVWFEFVATSTMHTIDFNDIVGSTTDLDHVVYSGDDCGNLTQLYCSSFNNSVASGLTIGQTYKIRVYTWTATAMQTVTFNLCVGTPPGPPANDDCANATVVPVNAGENCDLTVPGTINWSTASPEPNTCTGTADDDVWFEFVATSTKHRVQLLNHSGAPFLYYNIYSGNTCGTLTQVQCNTSSAYSTFLEGLTVGQTYKLRVYSSVAVPFQLATFDVCITTPPPAPANDECANATVIPVNTDQFCNQTVDGTIYSATASPEANSCTGTDDDDVWFEFTAISTKHKIDLLNITNGTTSLYYAIYEGTVCGSLTQITCGTSNTTFVDNLTIGSTYKIRVYSFTSTVNQTSDFEICVSTPPGIPANDECANATLLTANTGIECIEFGSGTIYSATGSPQATTCGGTADDDVWFEFVATSTSHYINISNTSTSSSDLYHVIYEGDDCGNLTQMYCSDPNSSTSDDFVIGNTYKVRVYSKTAVPNQTDSFDICIGTRNVSINVDETTFTAEELVQNVLFSSPCAVITNVSTITGTDFNQPNGIGYFNAPTGSVFPFQDGVILATTSIQQATTPPGIAGVQTTAWLGDADLEAIIAEGGNTQPTYNATILEFDFLAYTNEFTFDFLFASDEYGPFQCRFSDAFAFILTDSEGNSQNLAVIPGTTIPVSVVTIRDDAYNATCDSQNEQYFDQYNPNNPYAAAIGFSGQTVPFTAIGQVVPGQQYHIKFVIADYNDALLNSAVFLGGGSFDVGGIDLGEDLTVAGGNAVCDMQAVTLSVDFDDPSQFEFEWLYDSTPEEGDDTTLPVVIPNETEATLEATQPGRYYVRATYESSSCSLEGSKLVEFYTPVAETVGAPVDLTACNASGFATFDFTSNTDLIIAGVAEGYNAADFVISYHESETDAQDNLNPIGPEYENTVAELQPIYVRIEYTPTGCVAILNFNLIIQDLTPDFDMGGDQNICEGTTDATISLVANNYDPESPDVTYAWTYNDNALPDTGSSITITGEGVYEVTVNNSGCEATQSVFVTVTPLPIADVMEDVTSCDSYILPVLSDNNTYYTGTNATGDMLAAGTEITTDQTIYIFTQTPGTECSDESSFMVTLVATPVISITSGCEGGVYTLEVSLDDNYTEDNVLIEWTDASGAIISTDLRAVAEETGDYMVTVIPLDNEACSTVLTETVESIACQIPRGISPNGDGMNDEFDLSGFGVARISIFNRYGKEVFNQDTYNKEWHGQDSNNNDLPTGTYFYSIQFENGESKTGWVYINREN